jgi:very-short-patch-repair endonuclease
MNNPSPIEQSFLEAANGRIAGLEREQWIGRYRVDFLIREKRFVIELDGHDYHKTKQQRTSDASRQRYLQGLGYTVIRFTGSEIYKDVSKCVAETIQLLSASPLAFESMHPAFYSCNRLQEAIRILLALHDQNWEYEYAYFKFVMEGPWDPLCIEKNGSLISINHHYIANGDVVYDPVIDFAILGSDMDVQDWVPLVMEQPMLTHVCASFDPTDEQVVVQDYDIQREIASFAEVWGTNILNQGWIKEAKLVHCNTGDL